MTDTQNRVVARSAGSRCGYLGEGNDGVSYVREVDRGVVRATGILNTYIAQTGGVFDDQTNALTGHGPNYFLKVTGGLVALSQVADNFSNSGLSSASSGVAAFNISGNTALMDFAGSNMYVGAIGARLRTRPATSLMRSVSASLSTLKQ